MAHYVTSVMGNTNFKKQLIRITIIGLSSITITITITFLCKLIRAVQIWRCFLCKDVSDLILAFTVYVRPMMEYCSPLWSTCKPARIVQRRFTKRLPGFNSFSYDERCTRLGINCL